VQNSQRQRLARSVRSKTHRAFDDLVEAREEFRTVDEVEQRPGSSRSGSRSDVDDGESAHEIGTRVRKSDGRHAAERHADDEFRTRRESDDCVRNVIDHHDRPVIVVVPPLGATVAGQVEAHHGPVEGDADRVPRVRVLRPTVQQDDLRLCRAPAQRAHSTAGPRRDIDAFDGRIAGPRNVVLAYPLAQQRELVFVVAGQQRVRRMCSHVHDLRVRGIACSRRSNLVRS
jgi:hypothetical protein